ncbi:YbbR-like domain-containing protein [Pedobacter sp. BS3]|uniref:CdaR family protein n=1 Tax=Pedobacter sp. BS3 TaxID=2567937 RepID=UPI0011EBA0C7|nr:YbbR-like domain-containing protein [Pedobacter sp. BS3]TZF85007.1 YbbR-like domain-containing protein [Pedobacter sp. BS3]
MPLFNLKKSQQRKLTLFLVCLLIAITAWLFFALSGKYVYRVDTKVHFTNPPQNRAFHSLQSDTVSLEIQGTGWQLLFARLRVNPHTIDVSLKNLAKRSYVTFTEQLNEINAQLESNQRVVSVNPDTLYFDFSTRSVKKVPVKLVYELKFKKQYGVSAKPVTEPGYVVVTGPFDELKKMDYWPTDSIKAKNVSADITAKVFLKPSDKANIDIYPNLVDARIPIDQFTEKVIDVPVRIINGKNYDIKIIPNKIKVVLLTALSNYSKITGESFDAVVDMNDWQQKGYRTLPVRLVTIPSYSKLISAEPQTVDFIIEH